MIYTIGRIKGGSGKTTVATNLTGSVHKRGLAYLRLPDRLLRVVRDFDEAIKHNLRYARANSARGWVQP